MPRLFNARLFKKRPFWLPSCAFVSFVVSAVFLVGCAGPPRHTSWKLATGGGEFERLMWQAIPKKDWKQFENHLAPTFVGVTANGQVLDRDAWLEYWKAAQVQDVQVGRLQTQPAGDAMVVTFVLQIVTTDSAASGSHGYRVLSVWQQVKRGWILTSSSLTPVSSP